MTDATAEFFEALAESGHVPCSRERKAPCAFELADGKHGERWLLVVDKGDLAVSRRNARCRMHLCGQTRRCSNGSPSGEANATAAVLRGAVIDRRGHGAVGAAPETLSRTAAKRARRRERCKRTPQERERRARQDPRRKHLRRQ
jgi:hypothetical protein